MADIPIPHPNELNPGLNPIGPSRLRQMLGSPRSEPLPPHVSGGPCFAVTNRLLDSLIVRRNVGPFKVTGLQPAVDSLADVMAEIKRGDPALHNRLGTSGMLCVRRIANSPNTSNHSWGIAVDLKVDGRVDPPGNGRTFPELLEISSIFNRHGWYWGAEFPHEDAMHFEISLERMQQWHDDGRFKRDPVLQHGHFGNKVAELQNLLNGSGVTPSVLAVDKDFGDRTLVAVKAFQEARGLVVDGIVGRNTWAALRA